MAASVTTSVLGQTAKQRRLLMSVAGSQPLLEAMNLQRDRRMQMLTSLARSPAFDAVTNQRSELRKQMLAAIGRSPALESLTTLNSGWRDQILKSAHAAGILDSLTVGHQERYAQLLASIGSSPVMEQAFKGWKLKLPEGLVEQMAAYQAGLLVDLASAVPAEADDEESDIWFGAESWSRLVWEMVTVLKCAELMTAGMVTAKYGMNAPIPSMILYLLGMFIAAGELAAHFAEDAFDDD